MDWVIKMRENVNNHIIQSQITSSVCTDKLYNLFVCIIFFDPINVVILTINKKPVRFILCSDEIREFDIIN